MVVGSTSRSVTTIKQAVNTRSRVTGRFIEQNIEITFKAGLHSFTTVGRDFSRSDVEFLLKRELFVAFDDDFFDSFILGVASATLEMINTLIPTVALDTSALRNAIINLFSTIKSSVRIRPSNAFVNVTLFDALIDFQVVWSTVFYSIYHELEQWKIEHGRTFYKDPTTGGTFPYSTEQFFIVFNRLSAEATNFFMISKGWDLSPISFPQTTVQTGVPF